MIGFGFKILTSLTPSIKLLTFCLGKLCFIIFFAKSCPNFAQLMTRYYLELLYSNEAHPAACAMPIRRRNKPFFKTPVDWNLEEIMSMLMFHPD